MTHSGESVGDKIRKGVGLVHGTGETIRGNFNATVDSAAGDRTSAARHETVAERGLDEMQHGHHHGTGAGVTPVDTDRERQNRALQGEYTSHTGSTNHGPHATNIGNKADPRVDSDLDGRGVGTGLGSSTGTTGTTGLETGTTHSSTNYGPHSSNIGNKADPRVDSDLDHRGTTGASTTTTSTTGPHTSNLSNKLAGTHDPTTTTGAVPPTSNFAGSLEHGNTSGLGHHGTTHNSTNHGPHSSNLANKLDPRVDSDRDNRAAGIGAGTGTGMTHQGNVDSLVEAGENHRGPRVGTTGTTHDVAHGQGRVDSLVDGRTAGNVAPGTTTHGTAYTGSTNYGPHDSNIANKADPRVDSDLDRRGTTTHNTYGTHTTSTNHGPHDSNIANKADPRVDSDLDHRGTATHGTATHGTAYTSNTANPIDSHHGTTHTSNTTNPLESHHGTGVGTHSTNHGPHDSNVANKADPRVDSDLDGRGEKHGSATNGPHSSKIANVLDPRVDTKTGTWK